MVGGITINSNLAALNAQRRLGQNTRALEQSYTRLSSGLRISRASDDAAGLAISESLNVDARVFAQGVRNLNDGISLANIAEGALQELTNITVRQRELATQAANGTLSLHQRQALNQEANALVDEFNRIVSSADFNGTKLLDNTLAGLSLQGGYGTNGGIAFSLGEELARKTGDGTFQAQTSFAAGSAERSVVTGDLNGDGIEDIVVTNYILNFVSVLVGNGNGTFKARSSFRSLNNPGQVVLGDVNGDQIIDLITVESDYDTTSVFIGNGDATFHARVSFVTGDGPISLTTNDFNGDDILDLAVVGAYDGVLSLFIGNGNGTFKTRSAIPVGPLINYVGDCDVNSDGIFDLVVAGYDEDTASVLLGNGDGTFRKRSTYAIGPASRSLVFGDLNGDGTEDIVSGDYNADTATILLGNGDGTFKARISVATGGIPVISVGDLDGDGVLDIISADGLNDTASLILGNGDGTFKARSSFAVGPWASSIAAADFNSDGVLDLVTANQAAVSVLLANTHDVTTTPHINICTAQGAKEAMAIIDATLIRINTELGAIGSTQSRLGVALNTLGVSRENYISARSQICDADTAEESAKLVRNKILQQAAAAVLAQANRGPEIALTLLGRG